MKRSLLNLIFIITMLFSLSGSFTSVQAGGIISSPDIDQDGLLNETEVNGWYNAAGGPYKTNPQKADSDQDGLTDAEEKLFNTNPNDFKSPGISVKYDSAFNTFNYYRTNDTKYLAMTRGGDRYLLTEGLVIRRGTTFTIAAVNTGQSTLTVAGDGLPSLTPVRDPARGGWKVTVPLNGEVGEYTATITNGVWTKSLPIFVIFELPSGTGLSPQEVQTFLYDDNVANKRDEVAVVWRVHDYKYWNDESTVEPPLDYCDGSIQYCSNWQYHQSASYAQAFWTEQYTKKVLVNFAMPAIKGMTNQYNATVAISTKADASVRINYDAAQNNFSSATFYNIDPTKPATPYHMVGGACETSAGVFTAMLRSVGIASRPFAHSYNKTAGHGEGGNFGKFEYDTAVMMWVKRSTDSTYRWYAERTFRQPEDEYQAEAAWSSGTSGIRPLEEIGSYPVNRWNNYNDYNSDLIQTAGAGWEWQTGTNALGNVKGTVNTAWDATGVPATEFASPFLTRDLKWDSRKPLNMVYQSPFVDLLNCTAWKGDGWAPIEWVDPTQSNPPGRDALRTYILPGNVLPDADPIENWPYNPLVTACSPSAVGTPECAAFLAANSTKKVCTPLPGQASLSAPSEMVQAAPSNVVDVNTSVKVGEITSDAGLDTNGDGRFDALVVQFNVTSEVEGKYRLGGLLNVGENELQAQPSQVTLVPGSQTLEITFDGEAVGNTKSDGPYSVSTIWLYPADQEITEPVTINDVAAYRDFAYATQAYAASSFNMRPAFIAEGITFAAADQSANGQIDTVTIHVPLQIDVPGTFTLEGDLYDGLGEFVGQAKWTGSESVAALEFNVANTQSPYSLEHVNLVDENGNALDARYAPLFTIDDLGGQVEGANIALSSSSAGFANLAISLDPANQFTIAPVDANHNGRSEKLVLSATVDVTGSGGSYWMEGLLVDSRGIPAAWGIGKPKSLAVGQNQKLTIEFDSRQIFDFIPLTTGMRFTLIAVKIFSGTPADAVSAVDLPITSFNTPTYTRSQMERPYLDVLFEDDLESGSGKWVPSGSWGLINTQWNSGSHAYQSTGTGALTLSTGFNLTNRQNNSTLSLQFHHAYNLGGGSAELQISTNGINWTTLKTFSGLTGYWTTEQIDISRYRGNSSVKIRFYFPAPIDNALWLVDDVVLLVGPNPIFIPMISR